MKNRKYKVAIVGGGASGLAAAVELKMSSPELSVLVIEKMAEPARKLRATGSGRCNITNTEAAGFDRIMEFFARIGLVTKIYDNGLVYPYSESAADVAELLINRAKSLAVDFACNEEVIAAKKTGSTFVIKSERRDKNGTHSVTTEADYVILAMGGKAGPSYGTTGDGYRIAKAFGHSIVTPVPVLTGIECFEWDELSETDAHILAGCRTAGVVSLYQDDYKMLPCYKGPFYSGEYSNCKPLFKERGEVQFTRYGLSGICVFNMTRFMRYDKEKSEGLSEFFIKINLFPGASLAAYIEDRQKGEFSETPLDELLCTVLKKPIAAYVINLFIDCCGLEVLSDSNDKRAETIRKMPISALDFKDIQLLCEIVHGLEFRPDKLRGWKEAQATSGGVSLDEIDEASSESKLESGLYITGELADRDYPCGGFNLSNAWLSGLNAAASISANAKARTCKP